MNIFRNEKKIYFYSYSYCNTWKICYELFLCQNVLILCDVPCLRSQCTYSSFAFDIIQLPLSTLADALGAPQLNANPRVRECHGPNWQKIG